MGHDMRVLYDTQHNAHIVDELTFLRVMGKSAIMNLTNAIQLSQINLHYFATAFHKAACMSIDRALSPAENR